MIANILSISRILMAPVFAYLIYQGVWTYAFIVLFIAWLTDVLDGYLARKLNQESKLGKALDPAADKFFFISTIIVLIARYDLSLLYLLVITRDFIIGVLAGLVLIVHKGRAKITATWWGKAVTGLQVLSVAVIILRVMEKVPESVVSVVVLLTFVVSIICVVDYIIKYVQGKNIEEE